MAAPFGAKFDSYAQVSFGLVAYGLGPIVQANGVALVTGFIFGEIWGYCSDQVVTTWNACAALPTTTWTDNNSGVSTTWTRFG